MSDAPRIGRNGARRTGIREMGEGVFIPAFSKLE
jgi:hypothetical protein